MKEGGIMDKNEKLVKAAEVWITGFPILDPESFCWTPVPFKQSFLPWNVYAYVLR
jgi:hypothetical protein